MLYKPHLTHNLQSDLEPGHRLISLTSLQAIAGSLSPSEIMKHNFSHHMQHSSHKNHYICIKLFVTSTYADRNNNLPWLVDNFWIKIDSKSVMHNVHRRVPLYFLPIRQLISYKIPTLFIFLVNNTEYGEKFLFSTVPVFYRV